MPGRQFSTHTSNPDAIDSLHDDVPVWMQHSADAWIRARIAAGSGYAREIPNVDSIRRLERLLRVSLIGTDQLVMMFSSMFGRLNPNPSLKLDVIDGILQTLDINSYEAEELEDILEQSGSKWKVVETGTGSYRLEERVDATVAEAMDELAQHSGDASNYMKQAWSDAFGRNPNSSSAYSNTIKAIEAASWHVVTPSNSRATLGTIIRELTDHPENFQVVVTEKVTNSGIDAIRQDMSLVWEGQTDRHGTSNPMSPSQEAAEQAIFIGLSLCQQFIRSLVSHV
jgi:hypothetical protein